MGTARLEAFSDGVIAVAITLLVLQIGVPGDLEGHSLAHALLDNWTHYAAYLVSFASIGIIWINHHAAIGRLREPDHVVLVLNLLLLATVAVLPFATDLFASYLRRPVGQSTAAAVYGGCFLLMGLAFGALNRHMLLRRPELLRDPPPLAERERMFRLAVAGTLPYVAATGLAFVSPYLTLGICVVVGAYYASPLAARVGAPG